MVESGLIAQGSLRGLAGGTHFNRCKKIHPLMTLCFKILHFERFLKEYAALNHDEKLDITEIFDILDKDTVQAEFGSRTILDLEDLFEKYEIFTEKTLNGEHGLTPKFVLEYVQAVEHYTLLERAIRVCDFSLYTYALHKILPWFFAFNHQNYARYLTRHLDDLLNIETTHPGLKEDFENGAMSVRRTAKSFCRSPIDLTLEQTINADSANKCKGISAFTNSINARQRWSETHTTRMAIISELMEFLALKKWTESTETKYRSNSFKNQVIRVMEEVNKNINPFDEGLNPMKLFNLSSGKEASADTTKFLLDIEKNGIEQMKDFIQGCKSDAKRFEKPIKRNKIMNFSAEVVKSKNHKDKKIDQVKDERNLLGHMLRIAIGNQIDVQTLFSHPLTTVPHSLAHFDGTMLPNKKNELTTLLVSDSQQSDSQQSHHSILHDVDIIDGFYFLRSICESPTKYGDFAMFVLRKICNTDAKEIHIFFYNRENPSPKDVETQKQMQLFDNGQKYQIKGENQQRNQNLQACLSNSSFRTELIKFVIEFWQQNNATSEILDDKRVFLSFGEKCYLYSNQHQKGLILHTFENNHFEIESKMIFHMHKMKSKNIRVMTANPDSVIVHLLYHMQYWVQDRVVEIEYGDPKKNTLQRISVRDIFNAMTPTVINALPAWNIFTGCSYEPGFYGKGKITCWKKFVKNTAVQNVFASIGSDEDVRNEDFDVLEQYTCSLYGQNLSKVNQARAKIFEKTSSNADISKKGNFYVYYVNKHIT